MESTRSLAPLQREVLPPQKAENSVVIVLMASVAMSFAIVSSALALQMQGRSGHCPGATKAQPAVTPLLSPVVEDEDSATVIEVAPAEDCGLPLYRANNDGSVDAVFTVCHRGSHGRWTIKSAPVIEPDLNGAPDVHKTVRWQR